MAPVDSMHGLWCAASNEEDPPAEHATTAMSHEVKPPHELPSPTQLAVWRESRRLVRERAIAKGRLVTHQAHAPRAVSSQSAPGLWGLVLRQTRVPNHIHRPTVRRDQRRRLKLNQKLEGLRQLLRREAPVQSNDKRRMREVAYPALRVRWSGTARGPAGGPDSTMGLHQLIINWPEATAAVL